MRKRISSRLVSASISLRRRLAFCPMTTAFADKPSIVFIPMMKVKIARWALLVLAAAALILPALWLTPKAAAEVVQNFRQPIEFTTFDSCTGEALQFSGELHVVFRVMEKEEGTFSSFTTTVTGKAVGLSSGVEYVISDEYHDKAFDTDFAECGGMTFTANEKFRLISKGSSDNLSATVFLEAMDTPDCDLIVLVENIVTDCRG